MPALLPFNMMKSENETDKIRKIIYDRYKKAIVIIRTLDVSINIIKVREITSIMLRWMNIIKLNITNTFSVFALQVFEKHMQQQKQDHQNEIFIITLAIPLGIGMLRPFLFLNEATTAPINSIM